MRPPLHQRFVEKSDAAITAAVEVYNKPSFAYREETFAILALNAWELLLKAKVLKDAGNDVKSLRVYEPRELKGGGKSKKLYARRNRAGNFHSISPYECMRRLSASGTLPNEVLANLDALVAIRDNSVHYVTPSAKLARQAQELAAAAIKNFVLLDKQWFGRDLSQALNLILPLSFVSGGVDIESVVTTADESRLIKHLETIAQAVEASTGDFAVAVRLEVKVEKSSLSSASKVVWSKDPDAVKVAMTETDIRTKYPWDYGDLVARLSNRYVDFKANQKFHDIRMPLLTDERFAKARYLDPGNPKSPKKDFYNPNVLPVFDKHYTKK
ncbi:DUF3644 domain-containing protein [Achromobacter insolitus]|uniref:DUF3644 domain-containing protein n=1 Tax=Achromobacter insolitus TaxID=217204 RepID=UPI00174A02B3|nr:DUF3644 domain-containing protein [Achromobacter insolitus]